MSLTAPHRNRAVSAPTQQASGGRARPSRRWRPGSGVGLGVALVAPTLIMITGVSLYPVIETFRLSFRNTSLAEATDEFVGLENYTSLLADPQFQNAWVQTVVFTAVATILETILGMVMALVLYQNFKGRGLLRAVVLIPWAIPTVVTSRVFGWLFDGQSGMVNYALFKVGLIDNYVNFLGSSTLALPTLIVADVWKTTPFMTLLILAALHTVPTSLLESARVDGASAIRTFFSIRLPLLLPALLIAALLRALDTVRIFDLPYVLTGGGPADSTETLSTLAYKRLFSGLQLGYGSGIASLTFITEALMALLFAAAIVWAYRKIGDQR